jgi:dTDP-L-rhamnose 4-epimerase
MEKSMKKNVLITGGAGFIGSSLAAVLNKDLYTITVLDNLSPQIHGENPMNSELYVKIKDQVNFILGDVRSKSDWDKALENQNIVVHLAAETGTGQSMYEVSKYFETNVQGTSYLLDYLVNSKHSIEKLVIASSRAVYGEGKYVDEQGNVHFPNERLDSDMSQKRFDPIYNGKPLRVVSTDESSPFKPQSVYGITKQTQEQMVLNVCNSINVNATALRFQNVYGPGQSLKNPYTGILSIFSTLILTGAPINIFEDGLESRDFVFISDVVDSILLSMENHRSKNQVYNVGTGVGTTVMEVANLLQDLYSKKVPTAITGNYRIGDIRHNIADISKICSELGFSPKYSFSEGLNLFSKWVMTQTIEESKYDQSLEEMKSKGIMK